MEEGGGRKVWPPVLFTNWNAWSATQRRPSITAFPNFTNLVGYTGCGSYLLPLGPARPPGAYPVSFFEGIKLAAVIHNQKTLILPGGCVASVHTFFLALCYM